MHELDFETLTTEITEGIEIRLEHEAHQDWVAFVPQLESDAGAMTKEFGKSWRDRGGCRESELVGCRQST